MGFLIPLPLLAPFAGPGTSISGSGTSVCPTSAVVRGCVKADQFPDFPLCREQQTMYQAPCIRVLYSLWFPILSS